MGKQAEDGTEDRSVPLPDCVGTRSYVAPDASTCTVLHLTRHVARCAQTGDRPSRRACSSSRNLPRSLASLTDLLLRAR